MRVKLNTPSNAPHSTIYLFSCKPGNAVFRILKRHNECEVTLGDLKKVDRLLSFANPAAKYDPRYSLGLWDGRVHLLSGAKFPTGLLPYAVKRLERDGFTVDVVDKAQKRPLKPIPPDFIKVNGPAGPSPLRPDQVWAINKMLAAGSGGGWIATGWGKGAGIAAILGAIYFQTGGKSLVLVPRIGLLSQTSRDLAEMLDGVSVGMIGNGKREFDADVVVATAQTLQKVLDTAKSPKHREDIQRLTAMLESRTALMLDEAHKVSSGRNWYKIAKMCPAPYRFAVSGTLLSGKPHEDMYLRGIVGRVVVKITAKSMWERGNLAKPVIYMVTDRGAYDGRDTPYSTLDYADAVTTCLVNDVRYNRSIVHIARHLLDLGKAPMIFTRFIQHIRNLSRMMGRAGLPHEILYGKHDVAHREAIKARYMRDGDFVMLVSTIFDEGENVNNLPALIMAGGGKGDNNAIKQRIGRGMRVKEGDNRVMVFDFAHHHCRMLARHASERKRMYREQGMEVVDIPNVFSLNQYPFTASIEDRKAE